MSMLVYFTLVKKTTRKCISSIMIKKSSSKQLLSHTHQKTHQNTITLYSLKKLMNIQILYFRPEYTNHFTFIKKNNVHMVLCRSHFSKQNTENAKKRARLNCRERTSCLWQRRKKLK